MSNVKILLGLLSLLVVVACHNKSPTEPAKENIHPQVDIPWPSLANSPWPMFHHDPQSTGRSQYIGPRKGRIKWTFKPEGCIHECIAIGPDSAIYFVSLYEYRNGRQKSSLYAVKPDGSLQWRYLFDISSMDAKPLVTADGTIYLYVPEHIPSIYAISKDGYLKYKISPAVGQCGYMSIGLDNIFYFTSFDMNLHAMSTDGIDLWSQKIGNGLFGEIPSFSPDGKTIYLFQFDPDPALCAIDIINRELKWSFIFEKSANFSRHPMIDVEGNIYIGVESSGDNDFLYSISPSGQLNWRYAARYTNEEDGTIDPNGNIYFQSNGTDFKLLSLDNGGTFRWQKNIDQKMASLICDKEGVIFVFQPDVTAYTTAGEKLWQIPLEGRISRITSSAIGHDGILYVGTYSTESKLYAIE